MNKFGNDLVKRLSIIGERRSPLEAFRTFVNMSACACAAGTREDEYKAEAERWDQEAIKGFQECFGMLVLAMEREEYEDLMGPIYMELGSKSGQKWGGEFYTPVHVSRMMARLSLGDVCVPADRPLDILEPACGAGGMVLAAAEQLYYQGYSPLNMRATCVDVSKLACDMCYVNLSLWGIPATVVHGNSLSLETWGGWRTIMWPLARGTGKNAIEAALFHLLESGEPSSAPAPEPVPEIEQKLIVKAAKNGQYAMDFSELMEVAR